MFATMISSALGIFVFLVTGRGDVRRILRDGIGQRRDLRGLDAGQNVLRRRARQPVAYGNGGGLNLPQRVVGQPFANEIGMAHLGLVAGEFAPDGGLNGRDDGHQGVARDFFLGGQLGFLARVPVSLPMAVSVLSASEVICPGNVASNSTTAKAAALAGSAAALATARELAISFRCFRLMVLRWRLALGAGVGVGVGFHSWF